MPVDLTSTRPVGRTDLRLPPFGFGAAPIGGLLGNVEEDAARGALDAAWRLGLRYYDTAPWYGLGMSEHRTGSFLRTRPRGAFRISTKVGRYLTRPVDPNRFDRGPWVGGLNFQVNFDYSYDGILRSYEQSLQRLSLPTVDALIIHDLDHGYHDDATLARHLSDLKEGGLRALDELKGRGEIMAIGMGVNTNRAFEEVVPEVPLDFILLAMPYTLLDQECLHRGLARCMREGISVVIGSPFASGILAKGSRGGGNYGYSQATEAVVTKVQAIEAVCARHRVSLPAAALQFPLLHPAVASVVSGAKRPDQVDMNVRGLSETIPPKFWRDLKSEGLISLEAPTPT
jgi:D-threo-aldose 1-dehydrogenase